MGLLWEARNRSGRRDVPGLEVPTAGGHLTQARLLDTRRLRLTSRAMA